MSTVMKIIIRPWQKSDLDAIRRITWQSWIATYSSFIPESDLRSYFDIHYTKASLLSWAFLTSLKKATFSTNVREEHTA